MQAPVTVEISGHRYPIRSGLDPAYVAELAAYVDTKMRTVSDASPATDMLGVAVLVALNLADECFRARRQESSAHGELQERALKLEQMVDAILAPSPPADEREVSL
ncbi:MAG: cell division protein ZapA [Acidobacteria bacterium]|nr:cell division protein ZapA [Acidobacteriota bacterium]